jgi:hypothetical protein
MGGWVDGRKEMCICVCMDACKSCVNECMEGRVFRCVSDIDQVCTPQLFCTYFYNHAHRLRLEKRIFLTASESRWRFHF